MRQAPRVPAQQAERGRVLRVELDREQPPRIVVVQEVILLPGGPSR
jgi:hypothetical protein